VKRNPSNLLHSLYGSVNNANTETIRHYSNNSESNREEDQKKSQNNKTTALIPKKWLKKLEAAQREQWHLRQKPKQQVIYPAPNNAVNDR
jgi:hypothetical protein